MKRVAMRRVSRRRAAKIPERQELRREHLRQSPWCDARLESCRHTATDVHEIVNRSQDKEAWLKPHLFVSLCRPCHAWVTEHPVWSRHHGFTLSRVHEDARHLDAAERLRGRCRDKHCLTDHMDAS